MKKNTRYVSIDFLILAGIILLAIFLRMWRLDKAPVSVFGDEIDVGLQAKSLYQTGMDYMGNRLPVFFQSFAEFRLPAQIYLAVPFVKILGLNVWGVRLPSVMLGVVSVPLFFLLVKALINKKVAIVASLFLAVSPWNLQFSRQANDSTSLLPFIFLGILLFIKGLKDYKYFIASIIGFSLSFYSYAISSVFTPLLVLALLLIHRKIVWKYGLKKLLLVLTISSIVLMPFIKATINHKTTHRISYLSDQNNIPEDLIESKYDLIVRARSTGSFERISNVIANYINSYSLNFLFTGGDPNPRHSINDFAGLFIFDLPLIIIGLIYMAKYKSNNNLRKTFTFLILWLLIAAVPSSLTRDGANHAARLIMLHPVLLIISALGFTNLTAVCKGEIKRGILILFLCFMFWVFIQYQYTYHVLWPRKSWRFWHYGFEQTISFAKNNDAKFSKIYFNNTYEPMLPRFLFFYDYDMKIFRQQFTDDKHLANIQPGLNGFRLGDKYFFGDLKKPVENIVEKDLLVVASMEKDISNPEIFNNKNIRLLRTIQSPNDEPIFYLFTSSETDL